MTVVIGAGNMKEQYKWKNIEMMIIVGNFWCTSIKILNLRGKLTCCFIFSIHKNTESLHRNGILIGKLKTANYTGHYEMEHNWNLKND